MDKSTILNRIDTAIRFFLYVLIFWLPYGSAVVECCVIFSLILWIAKRMFICFLGDWGRLTVKEKVLKFANAFNPKKSFLNTPIFLFLIACFLSVTGSLFFGISLRGLLTKTLEWFVIYFLILEVFTHRRHIWIVMGIFLFSSLATCLDSIVQFHITHKDIFRGRMIGPWGRAVGPFSRPNTLGGYLTFVIPVAFSYVFLLKGKMTKGLCAVLFFVVTVWTGVVSFSRGAWIGVGSGILFYISVINRKLVLPLVVLLAACTFFLSVFLSPDLKQHFRISSVDPDGGVGWRKKIWMDSLVMIKERPVFGHGINTYMTLFQEYRRKTWRPVYDNPTYAHNCYIQIAAETGLVGLTFFLWIMGRFFRRIIQSMKNQYLNGEADLNILLLGLSAGVLAFLVHSFFDTNFYSLQLSTLFWFMMGVSVSLFNLLVSETGPDLSGPIQ